MATVITDGIVLRHADHGESDRMITLLTPELGPLSVNARGCRRRGARLTNATEVFCAGEFVLFKKQERYTLTGCTIKNAFYDLRSDYERLSEGALWLNMCERAAVPAEPNRMLFMLLLRALTYLSYSQLDLRMVALTFYMHFARISGFAPELFRCGVCGEAPKAPLRFDMAGGGLACGSCAERGAHITQAAVDVMRGFNALKFAAIEGVSADEEALNSACALMRQYIDVQLGR